MKTPHFKKKIENFKINKIMGRIKPIAKGPNPLSVKKKRVKTKHEEENNNILLENPLNNQNVAQGNTQIEPIKRERKRFKKVKNQY